MQITFWSRSIPIATRTDCPEIWRCRRWRAPRASCCGVKQSGARSSVNPRHRQWDLFQDWRSFPLDAGRLSSTLQAFDVGTGRRKWTLDLKNAYAGVTCADEYCYLAGVAGKVVRVDVRTGAQWWYRIPTQ